MANNKEIWNHVIREIDGKPCHRSSNSALQFLSHGAEHVRGIAREVVVIPEMVIEIDASLNRELPLVDLPEDPLP